MHKIYLKKNIDSRIKEIYSKYKNIKKLDIERDILSLPENRSLHFKRQSDGGYVFLHDVINSSDEFKLIGLIGNVTNYKKGLVIEQQKIISSYYENVYISTLLLNKNKYKYSEDEFDTLYIKVSKIPNNEIAFSIRFIEENYLQICNNIRRGKNDFDRIKTDDIKYCGLNLRPNYLGYYSAQGFDANNIQIANEIKYHENEIEIFINIKDGKILFANNERNYNLSILGKYIESKIIAISSHWNKPASFFIELVELGKSFGYLTLDVSDSKKYYEIISNGNLELINNKIMLNSFSKIYGVYSYEI